MNRSTAGFLFLFLLFLSAPVFGQTSAVSFGQDDGVSFSPDKNDVRLGELRLFHSSARALERAESKNKPVLLMRVLGHLGGGV